MRLIVQRVYRGDRPDKVPVMPGWGHILTAPNRAAARDRARRTYADHAVGDLMFDLEITYDQPERPSRFRWPWQRKRPAASLRTTNLPTV